MQTVMVVIPTYNERENLPLMAEALFALPIEGLKLLVVDDGSPDGTGELADRLAERWPGRMHVLHRTQKNGLGPAYLAGFAHAIGLGADVLVQMDADFSHQPRYIPQMLDKLNEGYDVVFGSRYVAGGSVDERWSIYRKLLSAFANRWYVRAILNIPVNDSTGGFRMWRRETLQGMGLDRPRANGYVFQVEIAYITFRLGYRIAEIPIHFPDRARGESKMDVNIQREAAIATWRLRRTHHHLTPAMRRSE